MLAGPLLLSRHLALFTLRDLVVRRRLPRAVCAGDLLVVHVAISNTRRRVGSWILVLDESIRRLTGGADCQSAGSLAGWRPAHVGWWARPACSFLTSPPGRPAKAITADG